MKLADLRTVTQDHTTIWLQDNDSGDCIQADELRFIDSKYDDCEIKLMFPEKYPAISSFGITVVISESNKIWIVEYAFSGCMVSRNAFSDKREAQEFYNKMSDLPYCKMYETDDIWNQERNG